MSFGIAGSLSCDPILLGASPNRLAYSAAPIQAGNPTPEQQAAFNIAKNHFRSQASNDALYLVYIGIGAFVLSYFFMSVVSPLVPLPSLEYP